MSLPPIDSWLDLTFAVGSGIMLAVAVTIVVLTVRLFL